MDINRLACGWEMNKEPYQIPASKNQKDYMLHQSIAKPLLMLAI